MDEEKEKILKIIEKNGCHIFHVEEGEQTPCFTYSIGIEQCTGKPELIVTGLGKDMAHFLINEYNARIKEGEIFEPDKFYEDFLEGFEITFRQVDKKYYKKYIIQGQWLYEGDNFKMLHLIWPDTDGIWPWDKKASKGYRHLMPALYAR